MPNIPRTKSVTEEGSGTVADVEDGSLTVVGVDVPRNCTSSANTQFLFRLRVIKSVFPLKPNGDTFRFTQNGAAPLPGSVTGNVVALPSLTVMDAGAYPPVSTLSSTCTLI